MQAKLHGQLRLSTSGGIVEPQHVDMDTSWIAQQSVSLQGFLANQVSSEKLMVRPEKWDHSEYDGLYIHRDELGQKEVVVWNASEADKHKGDVTKLGAFLRHIGNCPEDPIHFDKVDSC